MLLADSGQVAVEERTVDVFMLVVCAQNSGRHILSIMTAMNRENMTDTIIKIMYEIATMFFSLFCQTYLISPLFDLYNNNIL